MSRFSGSQQRGAQRIAKELRREEAEERNALTLPERTRKYRTDSAVKLLVDLNGDDGLLEATESPVWMD